MLPAEPRLPGARALVEQGKCFVVHAPRQTGKTTTLTALAQDVTAEGWQVALLFSCERARIYTDDAGATGREILQAITQEAENQGLPAECPAWELPRISGAVRAAGHPRLPPRGRTGSRAKHEPVQHHRRVVPNARLHP
jgi:hypothetical protein